MTNARFILDGAPPLFKEAIENLIYKWDEDVVDVSCIVTAFLDAREQIENLEHENDEMLGRIEDLNREVERLAVQVKTLSEIAIVISQSQRMAG